MNTVKITIIVTFCALSIATNYALIGVANVKVMDLIVFVAGFLFGIVIGSLIGIFSWLIYGAINPFGFIAQIWLTTMLAESVYGITGGVLRKALGSTNLGNQRFRLSILFATMGFLPTVLYDIITNIVYASSFQIPLVVAIFAGAPLTLLHEVANAAIFGVCSVPIITVLGKIVKVS
jgi:hypothetical protein